MPTIDITVDCPIHDSFRVQQVAGMFDVPLAQRAKQEFHLEMPELGDDWKVGLIVGPSGSGKSTVAERLFADHFYQQQPWAADRAVVDGLGERAVKEVTRLFTAVGFSSPPSWVKPYQVLSGGEQFRCDLARALAQASDASRIVAFDEFTSVVDRNVARVVSAAVAKGIRSGKIPCRFVAVTCHYDVTEWLAPDWVVDMATSTFQRRCLRRPPVELQLVRCRRSAWPMFARHHYLSGQLSRYARCFLALWQGNPVCFVATLSMVGRKDHWRISRIVTLPDYQGIGIGMAVTEAVADLHRGEGKRINVTASHPALINHCRRSPRWRAVNVSRPGERRGKHFAKNYRSAAGRAVVSFEYVGGS